MSVGLPTEPMAWKFSEKHQSPVASSEMNCGAVMYSHSLPPSPSECKRYVHIIRKDGTEHVRLIVCS